MKLRCLLGRHRWWVVGATRDQRYWLRCADCKRERKEGET